MTLHQTYPARTTGLAAAQHGRLNAAVQAAIVPALFDAYFHPVGEHRQDADTIAERVSLAVCHAVLAIFNTEADAREIEAEPPPDSLWDVVGGALRGELYLGQARPQLKVGHLFGSLPVVPDVTA